MSSLSNFVKRLRDIMRNDAGINGDAQCIEQIAWLLFLKVYDSKEEDWEFDEDDYESIIPEDCRWRNWAVDDNELSANVFAQCYPDSDGGFIIEIKQTVYDGAYDGNAAFLSFICHEICHVLLFNVGLTPVTTRAFEDNVIEPFRSVEWQAKALCGELQIPYDATIGMKPAEIMKKYNVTRASAQYRRKLDKK